MTLGELADELEKLMQAKGDTANRLMNKLVRLLRAGEGASARLLCQNEADKFAAYRRDGLPLIAEHLFVGVRNPWPSVLERKKE